MTSNAIHSVSFRLAGLSGGKYCLFCIQQIYFRDERWTFLGNQILHRRSWIISIQNLFILSIQFPSAFAQVSSSSHVRKRPAGQVCIGEAFSKLAKCKRDCGKWKILTRNGATYAAIPILQRARAADEELTGCRVAAQQVESVCRTFELCVSMS